MSVMQELEHTILQVPIGFDDLPWTDQRLCLLYNTIVAAGCKTLKYVENGILVKVCYSFLY